MGVLEHFPLKVPAFVQNLPPSPEKASFHTAVRGTKVNLGYDLFLRGEPECKRKHRGSCSSAGGSWVSHRSPALPSPSNPGAERGFPDESPSNSPTGKSVSFPANLKAYCAFFPFLSLSVSFPHRQSIQHLLHKVINNNEVPGGLHRLTAISSFPKPNSARDRVSCLSVGTARPGDAAPSSSPLLVLLRPGTGGEVHLLSYNSFF